MTSKLLPSFVEGADKSLFPLNNLPYGVFKTENTQPRVGVAIGNFVLDLALLEKEGLLKLNEVVFNKTSLNAFAAMGQTVWTSIRKRLQSLLSKDNLELQNSKLISQVLIPMEKVTMQLPFHIPAFSDFYASENHATNVGKLFRGKENALLPNWKYLPVGYNGRASTVFVSGTDIKRPKGQIKLPDQEKPIFTNCKKLDYEVELGIFIGVGNPQGERITIHNARDHIFGITLLNDWSARDIQAFEYQPLGPFLAKSFATSISPWVVPLAALEDFMQPMSNQTPAVVEYLQQNNREQLDIKLTTEILVQNTNERTRLSECSSTQLYWNMEQILAHHTVNNCIMQTGDLLGTGTISGSDKESWGSLLEITLNGTDPIKLEDGSTRKFLEDGDTIIMSGVCEAKDYRIGFGELIGKILPAA